MAVITVGTPRPVVPARRLALDAAELTVLADRAEVTLPPDLRFEVDEVAVRLDGTTAEDLLAAAEQRLRQRGALDGDGGVPGPVLTNLHGVVGGRQRVRTTYGGGGLEVVAYHWVSPGAGGSLVRVGDGGRTVTHLHRGRRRRAADP